MCNRGALLTSIDSRIEALEGYVKVLEKKLAHCSQAHGGSGDESFMKMEMGLSPTLSFSPPMDDMDDMESLVDSELDEDICAPTKHLVVRTSNTMHTMINGLLLSNCSSKPTIFSFMDRPLFSG
jgi:hypothetical protein